MITQSELMDYLSIIFADYSSNIIYKKYDAMVKFEFIIELERNHSVMIPREIKNTPIFKELFDLIVARRHFFIITERESQNNTEVMRK